MKVVCDACTAKYQIPDERVAGRKLKIRCRKCGGAIIIRGDLLEEPQAEATAPASASADEWHVSVDGDQHGPYTTEQMISMLAEQQMDWDVFVWREGMADWLAATECAELLELASAAGVAPPQEEPTVAQEAPTSVVDRGHEEASTAMYTSDSFAPGDGLQPSARGSFARRAQSAPQHAPAVAPVTGPNPASAFAPAGEASYGRSPRVSAADAMTGERNEDSVLFSMGNLMLQASASAPVQPGSQAGYASGEGSGLIDIRALASLASASQSSPAAAGGPGLVPPPGNGRSDEDQLMRLANQTGAFATVDTLAPVEQASRASSPAVPIAIFSGFALMAAAVFAAIYLTRGPQAEDAVVAATEPAVLPSVAEPAPEAEPEPVAAVDEVDAADEEQAADEPAAQAQDDEQAQTASPRRTFTAKRKAAPRKRAPTPKQEPSQASAKAAEPQDKEPAGIDDLLLGGGSAKADSTADSKADPIAAPEPKDESKAKQPPGDRSLDDLLDGAVTKADKPAENLPASPTRDQVLEAIRGVMPAVKACAEEGGASGKASAAITVKGTTGRVSSVNVTGIQGSAGSCIARAVRKAQFPKFSKPTFSINYPFKL